MNRTRPDPCVAAAAVLDSIFGDVRGKYSWSLYGQYRVRVPSAPCHVGATRVSHLMVRGCFACLGNGLACVHAPSCPFNFKMEEHVGAGIRLMAAQGLSWWCSTQLCLHDPSHRHADWTDFDSTAHLQRSTTATALHPGQPESFNTLVGPGPWGPTGSATCGLDPCHGTLAGPSIF